MIAPKYRASQDFIGTRKALVDLRLLLFQLCWAANGPPRFVVLAPRSRQTFRTIYVTLS